MTDPADLTVVILTYNEAIHLPRALAAVQGFARAVLVVDSYSTDATLEIARSFGAQVLQHPFQNQAQQFQWALDNAPIATGWVMRLDADEVIEPDLAKEIRRELPRLPADVTGVILNRKTIFQDKFLRYGGRYPMMLLRIWRRGTARIEDRWMDEHIYLTEGRSVTFRGGFADHNLNDLTHFTEKHNAYASREALDVLNRRLGLWGQQASLVEQNTARQAKLKRFLKESLYNRLPFEVAALGYFLFRYVLQLGFLDGRAGLTYHVLQGFWYRYLVGAKVREFQKAIAHTSDREEVCRTLERLSRRKLQRS